MAHKTYNLISLQICSILMSLSAFYCYETGSVGSVTKWPVLFCISLLFGAVGHCPRSSDQGGGSCVWQGLSAWVPLGRVCVPAGSLPASPSPPSEPWGHMPFTGIFPSHLDMRCFPLSLKSLELWISEAWATSPTRKGKHLVHIQHIELAKAHSTLSFLLSLILP